MKREILRHLLPLVMAVFLFGCSSTETNTDVQTLDKSVAEQAYDNAPDVPRNDTMSADPVNQHVSANNQLGRDMNIVAVIQQNPELSTLLELIQAADMVNTLQSPAYYTLFAPNNKAFEALPAGTVEALKSSASKSELTNLLQAHVLSKEVSTDEIQGSMTAQTAVGENVVIKRNGQTVTVGGATVVTPNVDASNGVVHVIDKVLVPPKQ